MIMDEPSLSGDAYRYIWDGRVTASGINPFSYPPDHPRLDFLKDTAVYTSINFSDIATVYPPTAQIFFFINYYAGNSLWSWKIILLITEALLTVIIIRLAGQFKLHRLRVLIFTLNPLVIIETYMNGHLEVIGLTFLWIAIYLFYQSKSWQGTVSLIPAVLVKFFPLLIYLPFMIKKFWWKTAVILVSIAAILLPFALDGSIPMAGFFSYINRWSFNAPVFKMCTSFLYMVPVRIMDLGVFEFNTHLEHVFINQEFYYKIFAALVLIFITVVQMKKVYPRYGRPGIHPLQAGFIITGAYLLLTTTLHPWYLIWMVPFLVFIPNWGWIGFTFLIMLSYQVLERYHLSGVWLESNWILVLEYIPFYFLLIYEYLYRKKIKGWLPGNQN
jgi:hypothetical protein